MLKVERQSASGEVASIPDYAARNAEAFLRAPTDVTIKQENLSGVWLVHDNEIKDLHYASMIESRKNALLAQDWDLSPGSDRLMDRKARDFVQWVFDNMEHTIYNVFDATLDALSKGFSLAELVWDPVTEGDWAGKLRLRAIKDKDQRYFRFKFDEYGNLHPTEGIQQVSQFGMPVSKMAPNKFLIYTFGRRRDNWYGEGLGMKCAWYVFFKKAGMRWWNIHLQKFGNPTIIGKYPAGATQTKVNEFLSTMKTLSEQSAIAYPNGTEGNEFMLSLLESTRGGEGGFMAFLNYLDGSISKRILGGQLVTDPGTKGARSLGQLHQNNRMMLSKFDALTLQDAFNEQVIKRLVSVNFPNALPPKLTFRMISSMDRKEWLENFVLSQQLGMDLPTEWVHNLLQIPMPEDGEKTLEPKENVRLGHRGGAKALEDERKNGTETKKEEKLLERYGATRSMTKWEKMADVDSIYLSMDSMNAELIPEVIRASDRTITKSIERSKKVFTSRSSTKVSEPNPDIDPSIIQKALEAGARKAYASGVVSAHDNVRMARLVDQVGDDMKKLDQFASTIDSLVGGAQPIEASALSEMTGLSEDSITADFAQLKDVSYSMAGLTRKNIEHIFREDMKASPTYEKFKEGIAVSTMDFTGSASKSSDAPMISPVVREVVSAAYNIGRLSVYKHHGMNVQFSSLVGADTPVNNLNDTKIYSADSLRWQWLLPPTCPGDRATVVAAPTAESIPPQLDPRPKEQVYVPISA